MTISQSMRKRFWARVNKTCSCWLWTGPRLPAGYGQFAAGSRARRFYAHRFSWMLAHNAEVPMGLMVLHSCDTPPCVNPRHLRLGTAADNSADCTSRGRRAPVELTRHCGEKNGRATITAEQAQEIRHRYWATPRQQRIRRGQLAAIAADYGLSTVMILLIANGRNWQDRP